MSVSAIVLPADESEPGSIDLVRLATVSMAITCVVWRAAVAVGLPRAAWPYIVVDLLLAVIQGVWTWRFALSPSRASYIVGAVIVALPLGVSIGLSVAAGAGAFGAPLALGLAEAVAFVLNLVLLGLTMLGALAVPPRALVRWYAGTAIGVAGLGITLLVGGLTHQHPVATPHWVWGKHGLRLASAPVFFCHLI
jgi:hypothetical protein